ncbi:restriction endonuclease subunit S [Phosphitispora sp. TUW77]|uniref:restriction endonuclease subunit S n=1 Tax=Phosphitispora sp. TUW77 TaxID=3152361 RepID=UPI003AB4372E
MSKMISVSSGFQYSVNIAYDLNNEDKLKNFIPTKSAISLLEDILLSSRPTSTERSRVLIGAYGKGKSHIVLMILSMLMKRDLKLFEKTLPKIKQNEKLYQYIQNYYESEIKLLPVVITGSNTSLPQAFMLALQRTLVENDLMNVMPETNNKAAVAVIERWKNEFPDTYNAFGKAIEIPVSKFISNLEDFNIETYEQFERIYPSLTAGSMFNPFLGFDVVELYEGVVKELKVKGYTGIYVVYDEFSKFLEANISEASVSDTKMLQDFAEKCNRSGEKQLHLMLISHKEIANYIDTLPKQKVDGWRGVSERFSHIHLNNNFSQTYEIIASVIQKESSKWDKFCLNHKGKFDNLIHLYTKHQIFAEGGKEEASKTIYDCYPLHPISTFVLPPLSERVAQNERTLFTFLSANGVSTLPAFLEKQKEADFHVITPDLIYDYFEPLFKKEVYSGNLHELYMLTTVILDKLQQGSLEGKIVKTLSLIYILEQFEKLKPTKDEVVGIFSTSYSVKDVENAINNLIEKEYVIYLKRSNDYLRLKQTSGVNIQQRIKDTVESQMSSVIIKDTLNSTNFDNYLYPNRYNDMKEMTRFFSFQFIDESEVKEDISWDVKSENIEADGVVYGIIPKSKESIQSIKETLLKTSRGCARYIFILPKKYTKIEETVREYNAISTLRDKAIDDRVLFDEYEVVYEDLREIITAYINTFTHPEELKATYIYNGEEQQIVRKAALTGLMSGICENIFADTPIINNEAVNKSEISSVASNSRNKIIAGLLRNELEHNLGLTGTGQEVSIMRSTLIRTGVLVENEGMTSINLQPDDPLISNMLKVIADFIKQARQENEVGFADLYTRLCSPNYHIGLRKGVIPIYLSAVFHEFKKEIIIKDKYGQVPLSPDVILQINAKPECFSLFYLDWNPEKEAFIGRLEEIFKDNVIEAEKTVNSYDYVVNAMKRWYMSLPKYTKEVKKPYKNETTDKRFAGFIKLLKQNIGSHELLFQKLPEAFSYADNFNIGLAENIQAAKSFYDELLDRLKKTLIEEVKELFSLSSNRDKLKRISVSSVIKDWCETLDASVFEQLFADGTDKCLGIFRTVTNDENLFIVRLAKATTDLRIEDWSEDIVKQFIRSLQKYKNTAESNHHDGKSDNMTDTYQVTFVDDNGVATTKRFDKVEYSKRGKLLFNTITSSLDEMGQSISEQEKRQILMEVLKKLC